MGNTTSSITSVLPIGSTSTTDLPSKDGRNSRKEASDGTDHNKNTADNSNNAADKARNAAQQAADYTTEKAKQVLGNVQKSFQQNVRKLEEQDHPAAHLIDTVCGPMFDGRTTTQSSSSKGGMRKHDSASFYSEDIDSEEEDLDSRQTLSEDEQTLDTDYNPSTVGTSEAPKRGRSSRSHRHDRHHHPEDTQSLDSEDDSRHVQQQPQQQQQFLSKPLASAFAKRCYFTKAGIGKTTQHYEGLTLTGNVVLMLAAAMKLKGCPTICDEDLRRVEQTYPNQFSRLPDELLLSSGWRRISKYCHFSNKPIPDGIPFFHSKQRLHPQTGGFYFLLAAAVGMVRPIDVEPLTRDTLVLLETDYPTQCDAAPDVLIEDPEQWTLVDKFCFFSGGPINTEEDVYYQADFDGNPIFMLAFLSPSLTPEELYKLDITANGDTVVGLRSVAEVEEVESVYDLTERDFHDLKLYHLGPCRALPQYILQPHAWTKVLPPHFMEARHRAILQAQEFEMRHGGPPTPALHDPMAAPAQQLTVGATPLDGRYGGAPYEPQQQQQQHYAENDPRMMDEEQYHMHQDRTMMHHHHHHHQPNFPDASHSFGPQTPTEYQQQQQYDHQPHFQQDPEYYHHHQQYPPQHGPNGFQQHYPEDFRREMEEEGAFVDTNSAPLDEAIAHTRGHHSPGPHKHQMDPPEEVNGPNNGDPSYFQSENGGPPPRSNGHHAQTEESLEVSKTESNYSHDGQGPPYQQNGAADYSYTTNPDEGRYYEGDQHGRDQQYYDSPDGPPPQSGSQDHEFFNAPSGGADDNTEGYSASMGFDPRNMPHPEDGQMPGGYYDDEGSSRLEVEPSTPGVESQQSSSPIKMDHLKRLARQNDQQPQLTSPRNGESVTSLTSPTSQASHSDYSHTSAMRGAQELLKRNRQRRQEMARRRLNQSSNAARGGPPPDEPEDLEKPNPQLAFPEGGDTSHRHEDEESAATWESGHSDALNSSVGGSSSVWTDTSSNPTDRSSRRALILQMAKARMKGTKDHNPTDHHDPITEEKSNEIEEDPVPAEELDQDSTVFSQGLDFAADLD